MMRAGRRLRILMVGSWLGAGGCTALRELPRDTYAAKPERRHVAVTTRDGRDHEFEFARFGPDTLTGFSRVDTEGAIEEFVPVAIPLEDVVRLSARRLDWYRTLLVGGAGIAAVLAAVLSLDKPPDTAPPPPPVPCTEEPCPP